MAKTSKSTREKYSTYKEASAAAQRLGIKGLVEYSLRYKEDPRLPSSPDVYYAGKGWVCLNVFLGTKEEKDVIRRNRELYSSYEEASAVAQRLGIKTPSEYESRYKEDSKLPSNPNLYYAGKGWSRWHTFLGKKDEFCYLTYGESSAVAQRLGIRDSLDYQSRYKEDPKLPANPVKEYKDKGWSDWDSFLGKDSKDFYSTYEEASAAAQRLGLKTKTSAEYVAHYKEDPKLPIHPFLYYAGKGWKGWRVFLGDDAEGFYPTYREAYLAVKRLGIYGEVKYRTAHSDDPRLHPHPESYYAGKGWKGWESFLAVKKYTYGEASAVAQRLGIKSGKEYNRRYKEDLKLPSNPDKQYILSGWNGWDDFLGKDGESFYLTCEEFVAAVKRLGITGWREYNSRRQEDPKLPADPNEVYKDKGWAGFRDLLGTTKYSYEEASAVAQKLGIKEFREYTIRYKEDPRLPATPSKQYACWTNWYDFLGKEKKEKKKK